MDSQKPSSSSSKPSPSSPSSQSLIHFKHLSLPSRIGTNLQFRPKVSFKPLTHIQQTLLDNLWCNRSDTSSMINALNCLTLCFSGFNDQVQYLQDQVNTTTTSQSSQKVYISKDQKIRKLEKELEEEKRKNNELLSEKEEYSRIILDMTKNDLEKQFQYLYLPQIPNEIKNKLFQTTKHAKLHDMIECQEKIREAYEENALLPFGIAYSYQTIDLHNSCPCHFCTDHFQIVTLSLHLAHIKTFHQWSVKNLMDFGMISKLIISRENQLEEQISSLQHPELERILWYLFEDNYMNSVTLLIKSVEPYYSDLMDSARHVIEIVQTPRFFRAEQRIDEERPPITHNAESSLLHHRLYQISSLQLGIYRPRFHSQLAYQDKNMIIFMNSRLIRGKIYRFQFYCHQQHANLLEHIHTFNWHTLHQSGDYQTIFQRITPAASYASSSENHWFEGVDDEELVNMVNRMEQD